MGYTVWAARLVVLAAFLDLFCQFPVVAPYARSLGAGPLAVALVIASYDAANLVGNLGAGLRAGRLGAQAGPRLRAAGRRRVSAAVRDRDHAPATGPLLRGVHGLAQAILSPGGLRRPLGRRPARPAGAGDGHGRGLHRRGGGGRAASGRDPGRPAGDRRRSSWPWPWCSAAVAPGGHRATPGAPAPLGAEPRPARRLGTGPSAAPAPSAGRATGRRWSGQPGSGRWWYISRSSSTPGGCRPASAVGPSPSTPWWPWC